MKVRRTKLLSTTEFFKNGCADDCLLAFVVIHCAHRIYRASESAREFRSIGIARKQVGGAPDMSRCSVPQRVHVADSWETTAARVQSLLVSVRQ